MLVARVDSTRGDSTGKIRMDLREAVRKKIEKWQEPPPARQPMPLHVPDLEPKKRRGGGQLQKMNKRYAIADMRKLANMMQFGIPEESSLEVGLGESYGMLGQAGRGKHVYQLIRALLLQSRKKSNISCSRKVLWKQWSHIMIDFNYGFLSTPMEIQIVNNLLRNTHKNIAQS